MPRGRGSRGASRRAADRRPDIRAFGAAPVFALLAALGILLVALGNDASRDASTAAQPLFWGGLTLIYAPITYRLLSTSAPRGERLALVLALGISLFVVRVLYSPSNPTPFDELSSWRQTFDLVHTGDLFTFNPLVEGYAGFPGLESTVATVSELAKLSIFHSGQVVIGVGRVVMMLALFLFLERVTRSSRAAGIGTAVYVANPSFLYFDAQIGHESLALPLAAAVLLLALRWAERDWQGPSERLAILAALSLISGALTVTHHMSSYMVAAFFWIWTALAAWDAHPAIRLPRRPGLADARAALRWTLDLGPAVPALVTTATAAAWFIFVAGHYTVNELGGVLTGSVDALINVIVGKSESKVLFQGGGQANSTAARALAIGSIVPLLALIPFALRRVWRAPDSSPLWRALVLVGTLFPLTLGLRITLAGSETSQRASEFVFVGLAFMAALLVGEWRWTRRRLIRTLESGALTALATLVFLGGVIISTLPANRQPGPFLVSAEARSISAEGIAAARFAAENLPAGSRVLADRPDATLLGSYGHLDPVFGQIDGVPITRVLLDDEFGAVHRRIIVDDEIEYIVVDRRQSRELPLVGYYVESFEPRAFARLRPLSAQALLKFESVPGLSKIYENGPIAIYDTSGLR